MKRVLIADGPLLERLNLRSIVEENGFEVAGEADNGSAAISLYRELRPDVVALGIAMPDMSGIEALKHIKSMDADARIIVVSSTGQEQLVREAVHSGAISYIIRPWF